MHAKAAGDGGTAAPEGCRLDCRIKPVSRRPHRAALGTPPTVYPALPSGLPLPDWAASSRFTRYLAVCSPWLCSDVWHR